MKKDVKKIVKYIAYANPRELKTTVDANGNNVYSFSYDEILFAEDKETIVELNVKNIENVDDAYINNFTKIVNEDAKFLLLKEAKIKEFKEEQAKIAKIEKNNNVKNLVVADKQPKKSNLVRNTLIVGAVATVLYFGGKAVYDNMNTPSEPVLGNTDGEVEEIVEVEEVFEEVVITKEMFLDKQSEVLSLLKEKGISGIDAESVAATLFLFNIENFDNDVVSNLMNDRILDDNKNETFAESFRMIDTIVETNATAIENKNGLVTVDDLILTSDLIIGNTKDVKNLEYAENKLVELVNSDDIAANDKIYDEAFYFILADSNQNYPYTYADTTVGGKYALNALTNYQLIRFSKDKLTSEEKTNSMSKAPAYNDMSDIMSLYDQKCNVNQK